MKPCLQVTGNIPKQGERAAGVYGIIHTTFFCFITVFSPLLTKSETVHSWDEGTKTNQCPLLTTTETDIPPACIKYACLFLNWKILSFHTIPIWGLRISSETVVIAGKRQSLDTLVQLRISPEPHLNRPPPRPPACLPSPDSVRSGVIVQPTNCCIIHVRVQYWYLWIRISSLQLNRCTASRKLTAHIVIVSHILSLYCRF